MCLLCPLCAISGRYSSTSGKGQSRYPSVQLKTKEQEKTELKELVIQAFQMFLDAEILTTAENFEWDRAAP